MRVVWGEVTLTLEHPLGTAGWVKPQGKGLREASEMQSGRSQQRFAMKDARRLLEMAGVCVCVCAHMCMHICVCICVYT